MAANDFCVFLVGNDHQLYMTWRNDQGVWSSITNGYWYPLGGSWPDNSVPCAGITTSNELAVFLVGNDGQLYWRTKDSSQWSRSWYPLGGSWPSTSIPVLAYGIPWGIAPSVYMVGQNGQLYYNIESQVGGGWSGWLSIGLDATGRPWPAKSKPALGYWQVGGTNYPAVFMMDADQILEIKFYDGQDGSGVWSGWSKTNYGSPYNIACINTQVFFGNTQEVFMYDSNSKQYQDLSGPPGPIGGPIVSNVKGLSPSVFVPYTDAVDIGFYPGPDSTNPTYWGLTGTPAAGIAYSPFITATPDGYVAVIAIGEDSQCYFMSWKDRTWISLGGSWRTGAVPCAATTVE